MVFKLYHSSPKVLDPALSQVSLFDLGFDSLDHATILLQVEETFDVKIPDEESENLITVRQIAGFVAARKAA